MRPAVLDEPCGSLEQRGDGGFVVGPEDRPTAVSDDLVLADDGLQRALRRHGVQVRTEEQGRAGHAVPRRDTSEDVPYRRTDPRARLVLVWLEPERLQVVEHAVCDRPFLPGRARQRRQLEEEREHVRCPTGSHAGILEGYARREPKRAALQAKRARRSLA